MHAQVAHAGLRDQREDCLNHHQTGPQDSHDDGRGRGENLAFRLRDGSGDLLCLGGQVPQTFIGRQKRHFGARPTKTLGIGVDVTKCRHLVAHQRMVHNGELCSCRNCDLSCHAYHLRFKRAASALPANSLACSKFSPMAVTCPSFRPGFGRLP